MDRRTAPGGRHDCHRRRQSYQCDMKLGPIPPCARIGLTSNDL
jgi:hypothetical protein